MNKICFINKTSKQFSRLTLPFVFILSFGFVFTVQTVNAQLDTTFGVNGVVQTHIGGFDTPLSTFVLPNGKILVFSRDPISSLQPANYYFIRYNSDGTLDSTYGNNGIQQLSIPFLPSASGTHSLLIKATRQPDGKIILIGWDTYAGLLVRVNENGTLDTGFASGGVHRPNFDGNMSSSFLDKLKDAVILPDGKILVGGILEQGTPTRLFFIRYMPNGTLDTSFNSEGFIIHQTASPNIDRIFVQSDGKFSIYANRGFGTDVNKLLERYNADGTLDNNFTPVQRTSSGLYSKQMIMLSDDKFVSAEQVDTTVSLERNNLDIKVTKYNSNGTIDNSFGNNGQTIIDFSTNFDDNLFALAEQSDGQIVIAGTTLVEPNRTTNIISSQISLIRLSSNGNLNGKFLLSNALFEVKNFGIGGTGTMNILPDGNILTTYTRKSGTNHLGQALTDILLTRSVGVPLTNYKFRGIPFDFESLENNYFESDGKADPVAFRPSDRRWYIYLGAGDNAPRFGLSDDIPVPSDYISDLRTDIAVFRPSNGTWYIAKTRTFPEQNFIAIQWGINGDIPTPADYDNDSKSDIAVFRPSNGIWYIRNSNDNSFSFIQWGLNGDKPVAGDYDGDGKADVAVWRPTDGIWYILRSSDGQPSYVQFGLNGDIPVQEDYDGDGKTDVAVWRPTDRVWYILRSSDGGFSAVQWGLSDDYPVPADYDGDKKVDVAIYRPSQGRWYVLNSNDNSLGVFYWGLSGDVIPHRRQ